MYIRILEPSLMPRTKTIVNKNHLSKLKELVVRKIDFKLLRSVDCDRLAKLISAETDTYINGITFKRLFGFTKYPFNPSVQTLDILSLFVGYRNWYEFGLSFNEYQPISSRELDILLAFYDFDLINNIEFHDGGIQSMSRKIALRFREDVTTFKRAIPLLAKKKYAQIFFIDHFPDYDNLCKYYYLLYEEYLKYSNRATTQLLCNAMLFLKSFWIQDKEGCKTYLSRMNERPIIGDIHPYLIGRYFTCNLIFESHFGRRDKALDFYDEYLQLRKQLPRKGNRFLDFPASEYIIAEGLLQVGMYSKCIELVELAFQDFTLKMEFVHKGYYRQMQLFWAIAKKKLDSNFRIGSILQKINPDNFYFISEKYFRAAYLFAQYLESEDEIFLKEARALTVEIGNTYLSEKLQQ